MAVNQQRSWYHALDDKKTARVVIERTLVDIQTAMREARPNSKWKPIIDYERQEVHVSLEVPIDPDKPENRRVFEVSVQLVVDELDDVSMTLGTRSVVSAYEVRDGFMWSIHDSTPENDLTYEIQTILASIGTDNYEPDHPAP